MAYRHAHVWLLGLFPLILLAFWPRYFSQFGNALFALHAHGLTASAWLLLLTSQSWAIHHGRPQLHRSMGLATFLIMPLFAAAGPLVLHGMAVLWQNKADPFHLAFGARLVLVDVIAAPSVIALVLYAFAKRRQPVAHASAMLGTALLVLPPILARLFALLPGFPQGGWAGFAGFRLAFHLGELVALFAALWLASRRPAARTGFGIVALATAVQMVGFETLGATRFWEQYVVAITQIQPRPLAISAGIGVFLLLWWAWRQAPVRDGL